MVPQRKAAMTVHVAEVEAEGEGAAGDVVIALVEEDIVAEETADMVADADMADVDEEVLEEDMADMVDAEDSDEAVDLDRGEEDMETITVIISKICKTPTSIKVET